MNSNLQLSGNSKTFLTDEEFKCNKQGYILLPYIMITTKIIIQEKYGTREIWQINKWMRFKLFINSIFYKIILWIEKTILIIHII